MATIQFRRDTASNWTSNDPTLFLGELGIETDTYKIKMGDGSTAWTSLGYLSWNAAPYVIAHTIQGETSGYVSGGIKGPPPASTSNVIQKFSFSSDANATDVGDLSTSRSRSAGQQV